MGARSRSKEMRIDIGALPHLIEDLSSFLMGARHALGDELDNVEWESVKLSLKKSEEGLKVELKVKSPKVRPTEAEASAADPTDDKDDDENEECSSEAADTADDVKKKKKQKIVIKGSKRR